MAQQFDIVGNLLLKVDGAEAGLNKLRSSLSKLKMPEGLENSFKKSFSNLDTILARYKSQIEKGFDTKADVTAFTKTGKALDAELDRISKHFTELTGKKVDFRVNNDEIIQTEKELQKLIEQKEQLGKNSLKFNIEGGANGFKDIEAILNKLKEVGDKTKTGQYASNALDFLKAGDIQAAVLQLDKAAASCKRFGEERQKAFQQTGFDMGTAIQLIIQQLTGATGKIGEVNNAISSTQDKLNNLHAEQVEKAGNYAEKLSNDFNQSNTAIRQADGAMQDFARSSQSMAEQVKQLQQSTQYFFGLRNMLNLFKRGIREAVATVKELDKAMTETAVVTKFSVSDMWAKLPEYTANANALGATVQDMYEATTLYYQQGLNSQQAMSIAAETMKMARIGGLEAADATDMMTAALRGFNMELNETSAQRINDVYSNLAAKTASNTEELGTAMQRTASIAASAGMSFEGTAAFLAQAIETTREPAENLGTAMKTIVARFTELKQNPLGIAEVDGEEVSYNKVDAALQSIGVSLKDANGQFRDLDQVFLDISQRWDSLTQTQQRYIATTAAGSRQQSRFIAMMSNYERTTQLMEYANNANGASNEQFGKTLDSLEAKLNKFQNAWKEFLMGIMNDSWTKGIVDAGTTILGIVNKLIDVLSFGGKAKGIQSFLSLFAAFKGLKLAGRGANALIGGLAGSLDPNSSFGQGFKKGVLGGAKTEISQATSRIEKAIYSLVPHIDKEANVAAANQYRFQESGQYNQARKELMNNLGGHLGQAKKGSGSYTAGNILDIINTNQLNKQQQKQFFQASPGLKRNLTNSLTKLYKEVGTDKKTTEALISGFKNGDLGLEEALLGNDKLSTSFSSAYQKLSEQGNQKAASELLMKHTNELLQTGKNQGLQGKELQDFVAKNLPNKRVLNQTGLNFLQNPQILTTSEKFANVAGQIGAGFMSAGSAIQMFGAQVSQINPIVGQAISNFGGLLTTIGSVANIIPTIVSGGPVAWGIAAAVTAIGGLTIGLKAHADSVKKKGQEIVDTYTNTSNELQSSIDNIKNYQLELSRLSTGVDKNGFNVNLDDSEYQRYQELVNDLIHQNPAVVNGWNSEGKAIINVNKALKDTIKLKQKDLAAEKEKYLSDTSGRQLINARNVTAEYKNATSANSNLVSSASSVVGDIIGAGLEKEAKAAGFDLDKLRQGDLQAVSFLRDHYTLLENIYKNGGQEMSASVSDLINKLSEDLGAYEEAIAPVVDYLTEYANTKNLFADLPVELTSAFNDGLKSIAGKDLEIGEMKKAANYLSLELRNAFNEAQPLLTEADEALEKFSQDLNDTAYNSEAERIAEQLRILKANAEAVGQVEVAQWYENQASQIENAISNSVESISNYINTLADNIANAKANFDALGEGIEDYYSLADQAHGLVETALQDKNTEGKGSKTFWNTYRGLASEDAYNEHDIDKAIGHMKQFQKYFTEGAEGSRAFAQKMIDWQDKTIKGEGDLAGKKLKDFFEYAEDGTMRVTDAFTNLSDEQYAQLASVFDLSADGFTAVLNKLRQFGDLDFDDPEGIRKALALDERSVKTQTEVEGQKGVNRLYYGESALKAEMADLGPDKQKEIVDSLTVKGSIQLPTGAENLLTAKTNGGKEGSLLAQFVQDTKGSNNQVENVMKGLVQSGEYNKDELQTIHGELVKTGGLLAGADDVDKGFEELYNGITQSFEDPATAETNNILGGISSTVNTIAGIVAAGKVGEGYLPDVAKQSGNLYNELVGEKGKADTWAQKFANGKDEKGYAITDKARYNEIFAKLDEYKTANDNYINELKTGRAAAEERGASVTELNAFNEEIKAAEHNAALIDSYFQGAKNSAEQVKTDFYNAGQSVFKDFANIRNNQSLSQSEKQSETASALTAFAEKLKGLNFSPEQIQSAFKENFGIELELEGGKFATDIGEQIKQQIGDLGEAEINAVLNIASIKMPGAAKGKNNTPSAIRRVGTMARGSKRGYTINGEPTLTGELGPELVWEPRQNSAYMVGEHGPQFANLSKNAVVWNAQQTKKIKKNSKGVNSLGTGAYGIHSFGTMAGGNVGGTKIPGTLEVDANANILDVIPPSPEPSIPVKADLQVEGSTGSGFLSKIFGGKKGGPSVDVAANITSVNTASLQAIPVTGNITELNNQAKANDIKATATVTKVEKSGRIAGEPITVKATATTTQVKNNAPTPKVSAGAQTINVTANTGAAQAKINQLINLFKKTYTLKYKASGPSSISVPISANFTGSWKKTVTISKSGAKGINNNIIRYSMPAFNSAAGGYGQLGPKGKGGLTLTGEKGFEIAWLPSENRSMILGTTGPQMLNLPHDAVVYTHEQSKKILKQKSIPAGSHANTAHGNDIFGALGVSSGGGSSSSKKTSKKKATKKTTSKKTTTEKGPKTNQWSFEEVIRFDIDQNLLKLTSELNKLTKDIDKNLKKIGNTAGDIGDKVKEQTDNLKAQLDYHQKELESYQRQIKDTAAFNAKISYNAGGKKDKEATINFLDYMSLSKDTGLWTLNEAAIQASGNIAKQEAIFNAVNPKIKEFNDGIYKEIDTIYDLQNQIEENAKKVAEAFYLWENELTEVYDLSQRIAAQTAMQDRFSSQVALEFARLSTGFGDTAKSIAVITKANQRNNQTLLQQIQTQKTMIEARERELDAFATGVDELEKLTVLRNKGVGTGEGEFATQEVKDQAVAAMEQRLKTVEIARKYFVGGAPTKNEDGSLTYEIDWAKFNQDAIGMNDETGKAVKEYFEKLNTANVDYNNAIKENTDAIKAAYDKLKEYQDYIVDFEDTLLKQLDEQLQKEIDSAEKLGSTITTSLKDLLDEVKRKLDERRKQEDNAKTERDISQKQQRLATLRADTSGGHQVEIAQLQKEIAEAQQSYGRTLEDQLLDRLQQQGDEAAKQRERQIELAQAQLDISNSNNKELVNMWLQDPVKYRDEIKEAWMQAQDYESKGYLAQKQLNDTFNSSFAELVQATEETKASQEGTIATITDVITGFGDTINTQPESELTFQQQVADALANISTVLSSQSSPLQDVAYHNTQSGTNTQGSVGVAAAQSLVDKGATDAELKQAGVAQEVINQVKKPTPSTPPPVISTPTQQSAEPTIDPKQTYMDKLKEVKGLKSNKVKPAHVNSLFDLGAKAGYGKATVLLHLVGGTGGVDPFSWKSIFKAIIDAKGIDRYNLVKTWPKGNGTLEKGLKTLKNPNTLKEIKKHKKYKQATALAFKTGGLADYTGPAWLDGTPSKPELVLNAQDTQNFLALRDVLDKAISSTNSVTNSYGGNATYEININVDKLTNDYDVDKVAERVKKIIVKDSGYRNVTQVRNLR